MRTGLVLLAGGVRAQGAPNVLTAGQVAVAFRQAQATDAQKRAELGPPGAVSGSLSAGAGLVLSGGYDQVAPSVRLSVSVDLPKLLGSATGANRAVHAAVVAAAALQQVQAGAATGVDVLRAA